MIFASVLSMLIHQSWQVALLASSVWLVTRIVGRDRTHLTHMLWALVLIKCITPPIWSSPIGLFSRMNIQLEIADASLPNKNAMKFNRMKTRRELEEAVVVSRSKPDAIELPCCRALNW